MVILIKETLVLIAKPWCNEKEMREGKRAKSEKVKEEWRGSRPWGKYLLCIYRNFKESAT